MSFPLVITRHCLTMSKSDAMTGTDRHTPLSIVDSGVLVFSETPLKQADL